MKYIIETKKEAISLLIMSLVFILYIWVIFTYTSFMPIGDDYGAVLVFLNQYVVEDNIYEKFKMLFWQHNEHRIVFNRIVQILQLEVFGEVDFMYLTVIGNMAWILTVYLLWKYTIKNNMVTIFSFVPVVLIMFTFAHSALMTWAMASLQQYWQLFFSLLAIFFLVEGKQYKAFIFMTIAIFTGGGGLVLIPLFLLYYLVHMNWKSLFITFFGISIVLIFYFFVLSYYKNPRADTLFSILINHTEMLSLYILTFLGNLGETVQIAMYLGTLLVGLFVFHIKSFFKKVPFIAWSIIFILGTATVAGLSRSGSGLNQAMSSRYAIYSVLFSTLLYLGYLHIYKNNKKVIILGYVVGLSSFIFYFILTIPLFEERKHFAETKLDHPVTGYAEQILKTSFKENIFKSWKKIKLPFEILNLPKQNGSNQYCFEIAKQIKICDGNITNYSNRNLAKLEINVFEGTHSINLKGWAVDSKNNNSAYAMLTVINDDKKVFYLNKRKDIASLYNNRYLYSGIDSNINISSLKHGKYELEIRTVNTHGSAYYETIKIPVLVQRLKKLDSLPTIDNQTTGNVEQFIVSKDNLKIMGWYVIQNSLNRGNTIVVDIDGKKYMAKSGGNRPDVVNAFKNQDYRRSGFRFELTTNQLEIGKHLMKIYILSSDSKVLYSTDVKHEFEIK